MAVYTSAKKNRKKERNRERLQHEEATKRERGQLAHRKNAVPKTSPSTSFSSSSSRISRKWRLENSLDATRIWHDCIIRSLEGSRKKKILFFFLPSVASWHWRPPCPLFLIIIYDYRVGTIILIVFYSSSFFLFLPPRVKSGLFVPFYFYTFLLLLSRHNTQSKRADRVDKILLQLFYPRGNSMRLFTRAPGKRRGKKKIYIHINTYTLPPQTETPHTPNTPPLPSCRRREKR